MQIDTDKLAANWKTTAQALLSLAIALVVAYTTLPAGAKWSVVAVALLKASIGFIQKDAGTVTAFTAEGIQAVPSHEIPNDPAAIPVKK